MHRSSMLLAGFVWSDFLSTLDFSKPFHVRFISSSKKLCPPSVSKDAAPQRLCVKLCVRKLYCCEPATDKRAPAVLTVTG